MTQNEHRLRLTSMEAKRKLVEDYKRVYKADTGKDLTDEEAYARAISLVTLVKAVMFPERGVETNR